jgi:hypothetical protein
MIQFIQAHWVEILAVIGGIDIILGVVVKWTPVKWDDSVYTILHSWVDKLAPKK